MSGFELFILLWVLPSLIVMLIFTLISRYVDEGPISGWKTSDIIGLHMVSMLWPLPAFFLLVESIKWITKQLFKERKL